MHGGGVKNNFTDLVQGIILKERGIDPAAGRTGLESRKNRGVGW